MAGRFLRRTNSSPVFIQTVFFIPILLLLSTLPAAALQFGEAQAPGEITTSRVKDLASGLPLPFIRNVGQVEEDVLFYVRGREHGAYFSRKGVTLVLYDVPRRQRPERDGRSLLPEKIGKETARMIFRGATASPEIVPLEEVETKINYISGSDRKKWKTGIQTYRSILYRNLYPGIDLRFYSVGGELEYDVIIEPGADPGQVMFLVQGGEQLTIDGGGDLAIHMKTGSVIQKKPFIYQEREGVREEVAGEFFLQSFEGGADDTPGTHLHEKRGTLISFALEKYDRSRKLVIDPRFVYSTFLGGSSLDIGTAIAADSLGNAYVTGYTWSDDFPLAGSLMPFAFADVFITKINPDGSALVFSTYLGGTVDEESYGIDLDGDGNIYVAGYTWSDDFPMVNALFPTMGNSSDGFVAKISNDGSTLLYSTFLGGGGRDECSDVAVDGTGSAHVVGYTLSRNFPTVNPLFASRRGREDGFVSKFTPDGSALVYSTYLGGRGDEGALGVAADATGNAYVTGWTDSSNFPVKNAFQKSYQGGVSDGFVTKINPDGSSLVFSTHLGGVIDDIATAIDVDPAGNIYVTGFTHSYDFPMRNAIFPGRKGHTEAFVTKFAPSGKSLVYSTFLLGSITDRGLAIAADDQGNAYIAGETWSSNFPTKKALAPWGGGSIDGFVTKIKPLGGKIAYSTHLGGRKIDLAYGVAVDNIGSAYVTGVTESRNFPKHNPLFRNPPNENFTQDAFVVKISDIPPVDYLQNGSFEEGDLLPSSWVGAELAEGDGRNCLKARKEICSFKVFGSEAVKTLTQTVPITGNAGDIITLKGYSKVRNPRRLGGPYSMSAIVHYDDATTETFKRGFTKRTHSWQLRKRTFVPTKPYNRIDVVLTYSGQQGAAWFDAVKLLVDQL